MSQYFTEKNSESNAIERMNCKDQRFKEVMMSLTKHLHGFVKEVEPTGAEWEQAIKFLTDVGHKTDSKRQEWILLSDTLGISMLVDAITNRKESHATESTVLGPFFLEGVEEMPMGSNISKTVDGEKTLVRGKILDTRGNPINGAKIHVWQTSHDGFYDIQQPDIQPEKNLRGTFITNHNGEYFFETIRPVPYPIPDDGPVGKMLRKLGRHPYRPSHIHFVIEANGYQRLVTHLFDRESEYLDSDTVFGVKENLIVDFVKENDLYQVNYDFVLEKDSK